MSKNAIPKYDGTKPLKEILAACEKNSWPVNTEKHDKQGSDWVLIGFVHKSRRFEVLLSSFNGRFIVKDGAKTVTEESTDYDGITWYRALLDFLYVRKSKGKK